MRGLALWGDPLGAEIEHQGKGVYSVPSCSGQGSYEVNLAVFGGEESCNCPDRARPCKHLIAATIHRAKARMGRPEGNRPSGQRRGLQRRNSPWRRLCEGNTGGAALRGPVLRPGAVAVVSGFELGHVVATPGALEVLAPEEPLVLLQRHQSGDWGDVPPGDARENQRSLKHGYRLLSSYETASGERVWVITEADRSSTCILLPEEY